MQGIIHRDLKPDNVILTDRAGETDFVKLLDFGIAARTESADAQKEQKLTQQGMVLGTPPYMSPEQFTGKALDARSDIYSLGVMTYEMLAGRLPFDADTPWQWATQHMSVQPIPFEVSAPAKNIPENMRKAILRALSKNKEDREPSAREYFSDLSDGGRMTVESHPDISGGHTGTAAMAQVPDFAPPVVQAQLSPQNYGPPPVAAAVFPPPSPMTSGRNKGGGKGLIIGLASVGGILLISIAVLAARSLGGGKTDDPTLIAIGNSGGTAPGISTGSGPTEIAPIVPTSQPTTPPTTSSTGETAPQPSGTVAPVETSKTATPSTGTPKPPPPPNPAAACDACIAAANNGQASAAVANFSRCTDAAKKTQCSQAARNNAPRAAKSAALNGNCGLAKAIIAGAQSMGAASGALNSALAGSSCK